MKTKIYILTEPNGEIRYVGKTIHPLQRRFCKHLREARQNGCGHRCNWIRLLIKKKYLPKIQLIGEVEGNGCREEIAWISYFKSEGISLVNDTIGGEGTTGLIRLDLRGIPKSSKVKEKMRKAQLGKKFSPEHIKAMTGIHHEISDTTRKMWSERNKKRYSNPKEREKERMLALQRWQTSEHRRKQRIGMLKYWQEKKKVT